jgi:hypothetical protein
LLTSGSRAAETLGSRNILGIKDPAVDALIDRIVFAKDRDESILRLGDLSQLPPQLAEFFEPLRHVAHDRDYADHFPGIIQRHDREFNRDRSSVSVQRRNRKQVSLSVTAFAGLHGVPVSVPVALPQPLGDDHVEGTANRGITGMTENAFSARIPEANDPIAIGSNDGIGTRPQHSFGKRTRGNHDAAESFGSTYSCRGRRVFTPASSRSFNMIACARTACLGN